jgi:hypothetical protein
MTTTAEKNLQTPENLNYFLEKYTTVSDLRLICQTIGKDVSGYSRLNKKGMIQLLLPYPKQVYKNTHFQDAVKNKLHFKTKEIERREKIKTGNGLIRDWVKTLKPSTKVTTRWVFTTSHAVEGYNMETDFRHDRAAYEAQVRCVNGDQIIITHDQLVRKNPKSIVYHLEKKGRKGKLLSFSTQLHSGDYTFLDYPSELKQQIDLPDNEFYDGPNWL